MRHHGYQIDQQSHCITGHPVLNYTHHFISYAFVFPRPQLKSKIGKRRLNLDD